MKMKKLVALLLTTVMVAGSALAGCGGGSNAPADADGKTDTTATSEAEPAKDEGTGQDIAVEIGPNPETIDPALCSAVDGGNMILHAFETLLIFDQGNNIVPGQAASYKKSADGLTYTFELRDGLKWSDGSPLTAKDFEYSFKRVADPKTAAPYGYDLLSMVKGYDEVQDSGDPDKLAVVAKDDKTLEITLASPCIYFDKICAFSVLSPVKKDVVEKDPSNLDKWATAPETYISNGPLRMKEWVPGSYILFEKNPNYRDADKVTLDTLKFVLMEDKNASYAAYNSGEIQMTKDFPTEEIPAVREREDFHIDPIMGTAYVIFNTQKKPFDNPDVRRALSLAADRNYIAETIMQGINTPATGFACPGLSDAKAGTQFADVTKKLYGDFFYNDNYDEAVKKAQELMAKAGYPDGQGFPTVEYMTNDAGYNKQVAEYLQSEWKKNLGVNLDIKIVEWGSFTPTRRAGDFEIARGGWVCDYDDASNIINLLETKNGNNDGKYSNPEVDKLLKKAQNSVDLKEHDKLLHEAEKKILDDAAIMPLVFQNDYYLQSPKLQNVWHSPYGYWYFMFGKLAE